MGKFGKASTISVSLLEPACAWPLVEAVPSVELLTPLAPLGAVPELMPMPDDELPEAWYAFLGLGTAKLTLILA